MTREDEINDSIRVPPQSLLTSKDGRKFVVTEWNVTAKHDSQVCRIFAEMWVQLKQTSKTNDD